MNGMVNDLPIHNDRTKQRKMCKTPIHSYYRVGGVWVGYSHSVNSSTDYTDSHLVIQVTIRSYSGRNYAAIFATFSAIAIA